MKTDRRKAGPRSRQPRPKLKGSKCGDRKKAERVTEKQTEKITEKQTEAVEDQLSRPRHRAVPTFCRRVLNDF